MTGTSCQFSNLNKEERKAVNSFADGRSTAMTKADKGCLVVILDRVNYKKEAE